MSAPFTNPVFRAGVVLSPKDMPAVSFEQARTVGKYFENELFDEKGVHLDLNPLEHYLKDYTEFCERESYTFKQHRDIKDFRVNYKLTPVVRFPPLELQNEKLVFVARESVTVCVGRSQSKLWLSLSLLQDNEPFDATRYRTLRDFVSKYAASRSEAQVRYYTSVISYLMDKRYGAFYSYDGNTRLDLDTTRRIYIFSIESIPRIDKTLHCAATSGRAAMYRSFGTSESLQDLFTEYFRFAMQVAKLKSEGEFRFFIQTSNPTIEEDGRVLPVRVSGLKSRQLLSLVLSVARKAEDGIIEEYYFTIGSAQKGLRDPRYTNAEVSSRCIMIEVGRGH